MSPAPRFFDCSNCPAFCCTYDQIEVTADDLVRLAAHFGLSVAATRRRYTKAVKGGRRVMRHKKDRIFGSACQFLDPATRQCGVYDGRPKICRAYPGGVRCGFYDFLAAERRSQEDPKHVPSFRRR